MACIALGWLGSNVVLCSAPGLDPIAAAAAPPAAHRALANGGSGDGGAGARVEAGACQVLVFPKRHLDFGSLVASYDLKRVRDL